MKLLNLLLDSVGLSKRPNEVIWLTEPNLGTYADQPIIVAAQSSTMRMVTYTLQSGYLPPDVVFVNGIISGTQTYFSFGVGYYESTLLVRASDGTAEAEREFVLGFNGDFRQLMVYDPMWLQFPDVVQGPTAIRCIGGILVFIRKNHAVRNDSCLHSAAHCLMMGGFPVAPVFYHGFVSDDGRQFGWGYHSSESIKPFGPFETLEQVLDHFVAKLAEPPVLNVPDPVEALMKKAKDTDGSSG